MNQFDEDSARREFQMNPDLQAEFGALDVYLSYERGLSAGRIRPPITSRIVTAEPPPRRADEEPVIPPAPRVSSAAPRRRRQALESRDAAKRRQAVAPDIRGIWQAHGPQAGIQASGMMSRFKSFEAFAKHVANHSLEVTSHGR